MKHKILKITAFALVLAMVIGIMPAGAVNIAFSSDTINTAEKFLTASNTEEAEASEIPPTFIIDESCTDVSAASPECSDENDLNSADLEQPDDSAQYMESVTSNVQLPVSRISVGLSEDDILRADKYLNSPYSYDSGSSESVNLNSGSLAYENIDYTLSGVNGLDLVIGRRYDSDAASVYNPGIYDCTYTVLFGYVGYYYFSGEIVDRTNLELDSPVYSDGVMTAFSWYYSTEPYYVDDALGNPIVYVPYIDVGLESSEAEENTYLNGLYGLGHGWSLMFSSIEEVGDTQYLHLDTGETYKIDITSTSGDSNLADYELTDLRLEKESGKYSNGHVSSAYTLYYKDGKREYFSSDGKLIGIQDRYGNTIKFVNSTLNGYPKITITDTLNRTIVISGKNTTAGHDMTVELPDSVTLTYSVENMSSPVSTTSLAQYEDPMGNETDYSYTVSSGGFNLTSKNTNGDTNYYLNLTTITHPTGAQTGYTYGQVSRNLGDKGLMARYRLTSRSDYIGTTGYNAKTYSYSNDDYSGYPTCSDPEDLSASFTYYTTVTTTATGVSTKYTFNNEHLDTQSQTALGSVKIKDVLYEYDNKLPTKIITNTYDYSDQSEYIQSIEVYRYDDNANVTAYWSPLAEGDTTNTEYKTIYTYNSTYSLPLSVTYKQDTDTTVRYVYTPDTATGKNIGVKAVYVNGVLQSQTDYTYDRYGNVATKKDYKDGFNSSVLTEYTYNYNYDNNGYYLKEEKITDVLDADGTDAAGTAGSADGTITTADKYDYLGRLWQETDRNGSTITYAYNNNSDLITMTNPDSTTVQYNRNYTSNYVIVTDENGNQIKYDYNGLGLEEDVVDVYSGNVMTAKEYDSLSRLASLTDNIYGSVTAYTYDYLSRVTEKVVTDGTATLSDTAYGYTDACENGTLKKVTQTIAGDTNAPSIVTTQYTDKMGNVVKNGKILDSVEHFDTYTYDYKGNQLTEKLAYAYELTTEPDYTSKWEYDYAGRVVKAYNADGNYMQYGYDALGNNVSSTDYAGTETAYTYDSLGRLLTQTAVIDNDGTNTYYGTTKYYYDPAGNVISQLVSNNAEGETDAWSRTDYEYDSRGRLEYVTVYDDSSIDNVTKYTYDDVGNTLTMRTGMSSKTASDGESTSYTYDRFGNTLTLTDPLGQEETCGYTTLGKLNTKTDRNGNVTEYVYDGLGRLLSTSVTANGEQDAMTVAYALTGATESETNDTATVEYRHDELGRVIQTDETGSVVKQYTYDLANNRKTFTLSVGGTTEQNTSYTYDNQNRLKTVSEDSALKAAYTYDVNGNRNSLTYANGSSVDYDYNDANLVTNITNKAGATVLSSYSYTYYADGSQHTKTDNSGTVTTYAYDDAGRVTSESDSTGLSISYEYDRFSNRTEMDVNDDEDYTVEYEYDGNNRLQTEEKTMSDAAETTTYFYDPNGNQISKAEERVASGSGSEEYALTNGVAGGEINGYNGFNQLVSVTTDGVEASYTYYPSGLRASKTVNGTETKYILDGDNVVLEMSGGNVTGQYIRGINLICSVIGTDMSYYLYNAHGDVVQLADTSGAVTKEYDYDAFGNEKDIAAGDANPYRYCGEYYDSETNTYYLRARNYDPTTGRFLSEDTHWNPSNSIYGDNPLALNQREDPLGLNMYTYMPDITAIMQSGNLYVYAMNNPILYKDANGEIGILATVAIGAGIGALVSGGFQIFHNIRNGQSWTQGLGRALLSGAVSGAIAVIPIPGINAWASVAVTGAAGNLAGQLIVGEVKSGKDVVSALGAGAAAGIIGKGAADLLSKGFQSYFQTLTKAQQKSILNNIGNISNRELTAIRQAFKNGINSTKLDQLVAKYGYDVVVSAFVSSTTATAVQ